MEKIAHNTTWLFIFIMTFLIFSNIDVVLKLSERFLTPEPVYFISGWLRNSFINSHNLFIYSATLLFISVLREIIESIKNKWTTLILFFKNILSFISIFILKSVLFYSVYSSLMLVAENFLSSWMEFPAGMIFVPLTFLISIGVYIFIVYYVIDEIKRILKTIDGIQNRDNY